MITLLVDESVQVDDLKEKLFELKEMIKDLKKNFVPSEADCTGMAG